MQSHRKGAVDAEANPGHLALLAYELADVCWEISRSTWNEEATKVDEKTTVGNTGSGKVGDGGGSPDDGTAVSNRTLQRLVPQAWQVLQKVNITSLCSDLRAVVSSSRKGRGCGVLAMYQTESALAESQVGSCLDTVLQQWCLSALRLADSPEELDAH